MKILSLATAGLVALSALAPLAIATPAAAQEHREVRRDVRVERHVVRTDGPQFQHRSRQICKTVWRNHRRVQTCRTVHR